MVREVYVAATDTEARNKAIHDMLGWTCHYRLLLLFGALNLMRLFKHDPPLPKVGQDDCLALMEHA